MIDLCIWLINTDTSSIIYINDDVKKSIFKVAEYKCKINKNSTRCIVSRRYYSILLPKNKCLNSK